MVFDEDIMTERGSDLCLKFILVVFIYLYIYLCLL